MEYDAIWNALDGMLVCTVAGHVKDGDVRYELSGVASYRPSIYVTSKPEVCDHPSNAVFVQSLNGFFAG